MILLLISALDELIKSGGIVRVDSGQMTANRVDLRGIGTDQFDHVALIPARDQRPISIRSMGEA